MDIFISGLKVSGQLQLYKKGISVGFLWQYRFISNLFKGKTYYLEASETVGSIFKLEELKDSGFQFSHAWQHFQGLYSDLSVLLLCLCFSEAVAWKNCCGRLKSMKGRTVKRAGGNGSFTEMVADSPVGDQVCRKAWKHRWALTMSNTDLCTLWVCPWMISFGLSSVTIRTQASHLCNVEFWS